MKLPTWDKFPSQGIDLNVQQEPQSIDLTVFVNPAPTKIDPFYAGNIRNRRAQLRLVRGGKYGTK